MPTLKVEIPAITLTIEYDKKISLTTLVFIVLAIARILLKQILEQINEKLRNTAERGMKEGKNTETVMQITVVTMLGEITFWARIRKRRTIVQPCRIREQKEVPVRHKSGLS